MALDKIAQKDTTKLQFKDFGFSGSGMKSNFYGESKLEYPIDYSDRNTFYVHGIELK